MKIINISFYFCNMKPKLKYPDDYINKIVCDDALDAMKKMPSESIDLAITSPPYNLKNSTGNGMKDGRGGKWENAALVQGYSHYDDNMPHDAYDKWQNSCLKEMLRLLRNDGAIFYNHKWRVQAGLIQDRREKLNISDKVIIGMGGIVLNDITESGTYVGAPIRKIK